MLRFRGPWQRSLRHEKEPVDWRKFTLGFVIAIVVTGLELIGFNRGMQRHAIDSTFRGAIIVDLIDETPPLEIVEPPLPEPEPLQSRPSKIRIDTPKTLTKPPPVVKAEPDSKEMNARIGGTGSAAQLFDASGRVRIPDAAARPSAPVAATQQQRARENWKALQERGENPLNCQRTRFAQAFRKDQSVGDAVAGKYLKYIGLANNAQIARNLEERESRATDGCDPAR
ncbi:MAG: hypothetical protein WBP11_06985 [Dokdonella sp.]